MEKKPESADNSVLVGIMYILYTLLFIFLGTLCYTIVDNFWREKLIKDGLYHYTVDEKTGDIKFERKEKENGS